MKVSSKAGQQDKFINSLKKYTSSGHKYRYN